MMNTMTLDLPPVHLTRYVDGTEAYNMLSVNMSQYNLVLYMVNNMTIILVTVQSLSTLVQFMYNVM